MEYWADFKGIKNRRRPHDLRGLRGIRKSNTCSECIFCIGSQKVIWCHDLNISKNIQNKEIMITANDDVCSSADCEVQELVIIRIATLSNLQRRLNENSPYD